MRTLPKVPLFAGRASAHPMVRLRREVRRGFRPDYLAPRVQWLVRATQPLWWPVYNAIDLSGQLP